MGSPTFSLRARSTSSSVKRSATERCTRMRSAAVQPLARQVVAADDGRVRGALQVRVGQHDLRAVCRARARHSRRPASRATCSPVSTEPVNTTDATPGCRTSSWPMSPRPCTRLTVPAGKPTSSSSLHEQLRAQRRVLRRLPDHGAARGQAVHDRDAGDVDGEVPRRHCRDDADGLLHHDDALAALALLRRRQHLPGVAQHVLRRAPEVVAGELLHLLARLADRLADLAGDRCSRARRCRSPMNAAIVTHSARCSAQIAGSSAQKPNARPTPSAVTPLTTMPQSTIVTPAERAGRAGRRAARPRPPSRRRSRAPSPPRRSRARSRP